MPERALGVEEHARTYAAIFEACAHAMRGSFNVCPSPLANYSRGEIYEYQHPVCHDDAPHYSYDYSHRRLLSNQGPP